MDHKLGISSISLGWHTSHTFERKVQAAQRAGIKGFELYNTDLNNFAKRHGLLRIQAADAMGKLCKQSGIEIFCLGSFDNFEGQPTPLEDRLEIAKEWIEIAQRLGADIIQIPASDSKNAIGDDKIIITELQALADLGLKQTPPISFAYEALAWSTHVADWEESLRVVQHVQRPNFGLCLDTYHVLARVWADPRSSSGLRPGGASSLRDSIQRFRDFCPSEKIVYVQLSDAERPIPPILPGHPAYRENEDGTHSWCLYGRLFPYEKEHGAYLPMNEILCAWLQESKWSGWVSMEVFHRKMAEEDMGPEIWAERGRESWYKVRMLLENKQSS